MKTSSVVETSTPVTRDIEESEMRIYRIGQEAIGTVPELCSPSFARSSNRIATIFHHVRGEKFSAIKTATRIGEDLMRDRLSDRIVQILWLNEIVCVCSL